MTGMSKVLRILLAFVALCGNAHASFHLWEITQLYSNADGKVQFVELTALYSGQQYVAGHTISSSQGSTTHTYTLTSNLNDDTGMMSDGDMYMGMMMPMQSYKSLLLGTQGFADLGVVRPDFILPDGFLFTTNGRVDWGGGFDVMSYATLPTDGRNALFRTGAVTMNLPLNFDGLSGSIVAPAALPNYTDLWWAGDTESGWGINFNHQSDTIFASLFTYAADSSGLWLVATMNKQTDGTYTGDLYQTTGPVFNASTWTAITPTKVGTMSTSFSGRSQGTLAYSVNGTGVTKAITRQVFDTEPTCTFTSGSRLAATNYQDLWWNPNESGWGINFTQQGSIIFATLFTYGSSGKGMWLVASMPKQADGSFSGDLLRTTGPMFNTVPWSPTAVSSTKAGTMRVAFTNGTAGTLTYSVDNANVSKSIQRQVFGTTQSVCN
jgi:hypothetical protein